MKRNIFGGLLGVMAALIIAGSLAPQRVQASDYQGSMCREDLKPAALVDLVPNNCAWKGDLSGDLLQYDHHNLEGRALGYIPGAAFMNKKDHNRKGAFVPGATVWGFLQDIQLGPERIESFKLKNIKNFEYPVKVDIHETGLYTVTTFETNGRFTMDVSQDDGSVIGLKFADSKEGEKLSVEQISMMAVLANNIWQLLGKDSMSRLDLGNYPAWYQDQLRNSYNPE